MATNYLLAGMIFQGGVGGGVITLGGGGGGVGTRSPGSYICVCALSMNIYNHKSRIWSLTTSQEFPSSNSFRPPFLLLTRYNFLLMGGSIVKEAKRCKVKRSFTTSVDQCGVMVSWHQLSSCSLVVFVSIDSLAHFKQTPRKNPQETHVNH